MLNSILEIFRGSHSYDQFVSITPTEHPKATKTTDLRQPAATCQTQINEERAAIVGVSETFSSTCQRVVRILGMLFNSDPSSTLKYKRDNYASILWGDSARRFSNVGPGSA